MLKNLISVVIPIYNVENFLEDCLDSVISQSYSELEIILVNDGSLDQSGNICDKYSAKDSRIKVYHKLNGGLSDARNFGVKKSKGDYITFVDSDDFLASNYIEELYFSLIQTGADVSVCDYSKWHNDKSMELINSTSKRCITLSRTELFGPIYHRYKDPFTTAWGILIRSDIAKKVTFPLVNYTRMNLQLINITYIQIK